MAATLFSPMSKDRAGRFANRSIRAGLRHPGESRCTLFRHWDNVRHARFP